MFDNKVFISASYRTGGALIEVRPDFSHRVAWTTQEFGLHFNTPIYRNGYLYRIRWTQRAGCVARPAWMERRERSSGAWFLNGTKCSPWRGERRPQLVGTYRGSLLAADGQFLCLGELGHLLWMDLTPKGYKEVARSWLFAARESWTLPVFSRGLLYVVQNTRDLLTGTGPRLLCYDLRGEFDCDPSD